MAGQANDRFGSLWRALHSDRRARRRVDPPRRQRSFTPRRPVAAGRTRNRSGRWL